MLKETKRTLALVLALIMMFGTFSGSLGTAAYADEPETEEIILPAEEAEAEELPEKEPVKYPAFRQSAFIDWDFESEIAARAEKGDKYVDEGKGLHLTLSAPEGVFPEGSELKVALRDYADVNLAVSKEREAGYNVREKYCFQVGVYGADGETYISPNTSGDTVPVTVSITIDELPDAARYSKVSLYRTSNLEGRKTDKLYSEEELEGNTVTAEAYGLGYWTLEFEYLLSYRLTVNEEVLLKDICDYHHLSGTPSQVISKAPGLFAVTQNESGEYVVKALSAFGGAELELWYDGVKYSVMLDAVPGAAPAEEEEAEEAEEAEETEEEAEEPEEGCLITFMASEGGKVAFAPETGAEAELKDGLEQRIKATSDLKDVIAVADEGYTFKGWMYKGEKFHEGETFTWANVPMLEDSGFVAAFVKTYYEETTESGVTVSVTAPVGAFPEGTVMKVRDVEADDEVLDAVKSAVADGSVVRKVQAVDISFWAGGMEIEPNGKIQVKITSDLIREASTPQIVHVPDAEDADGEAKVMATDPVAENSDEMSFESDKFSTYVVAEVLETEHIDAYGNVYDVTVTYTADAKVPEGSRVVVKEFAEDTEEYFNARNAVIAAKQAKGEEIDQEEFKIAVLDISIEDPDGVKIEPADSVHVDLKIKSLPDVKSVAAVANTLEVQHLDESEGGIEVETVATPNQVEVSDSAITAEFDIDSFSTFALTWGSGSATIHYGQMVDGSFEEFEEDKVAFLDTTAASVSLANTFDGYSCYGAYYKESESALSSGDIDMNLYKTETGWDMIRLVSDEDGVVSEVRTPIADGSHIYVIYGAKMAPTPSQGSEDEGKGPVTEKNVTVNDDGTATITLDINAPEYESTTKVGANVIVILDTTRSMSYGMNSEQTPADWHNNRMEAARAALITLVDTLNMDTNEINFALAEFNLVGSTHSWGTDVNWTQNDDTIHAYIDSRDTLNYTTSTSGTNWEIGLRQGQSLVQTARTDDDMKNNKTYVIFVTDGDPNRWEGYNYGNNDFSHNTEAVQHAQDEANAISATQNVDLYGVFCGTSSGEARLRTLITTAAGKETISAGSAEDIKQAFQNIAQTIVSELGSSEVSIDDGIPQLANISAAVSGTAGGYEYYTATLDEGETVDDLTDADFSPWSGAPGASFSEDNGVTWDLSSVDQLDGNTVYRIRFKVWPSQEAYDIIANLNNGTVSWDSLDDSIKAQINKNGNTYSLKTNTHLNQSYSFNGHSYTDPVVFEEAALPLVSYTMNVNKFWDDSINPRNRTDKVDFYLKVGDLYYQKDGTFANSKANAYILETSKDTTPAWYDSVQIAPGFATLNSDNTLDVKEVGHKYVLEEIPSTDPNYEGYSQEFTSQTVRPMVINGTLTNLVLVDEDNPKPDGRDTYTIDGETYFVNGTTTASLTGTNHKTAELDITKAIDGSKSDKTEDQLNAETFTYEVTFTVPDGTDETTINGINYWIYVPATDGWTLPEYNTGNPGAGYEPYGYAAAVEYTGDLGPDENHPTTASGTTVTATVTITRDQVIRFTNLPTGTTYKIVETQANGAALNSQGYTIKSVKFTKGTASKTTIDNDTITGEIEAYNTRYYNQFTNQLSSVDQEIKVKKVAEGYTIGNEEYTFTISADEGTPMPEETTVTINKDTPDLTASFGSIRFTAAGTYTYTITETNAGQVVGSITYGEAQTVTVTVELVDGKLAVTEVTDSGLATVTNTEEKVEIPVDKTWVNADGSTTWPSGVTVTVNLMNGTTQVATTT